MIILQYLFSMYTNFHINIQTEQKLLSHLSLLSSRRRRRHHLFLLLGVVRFFCIVLLVDAKLCQC